jgi:hypothetical protein
MGIQQWIEIVPSPDAASLNDGSGDQEDGD